MALIQNLKLALIIILLTLAGCKSRDSGNGSIQAEINADGQLTTLAVKPGTNVFKVVESANIMLTNLDRLDPPGTTIVTDLMKIQVIRVREEFENEEKIIPFERQTMRNESLPEGQTMLVQPGVNGVQQITYRRLYENNTEISRSIFKTANITETRPEIIMVGVQTPFTPKNIPGQIAYITAGNAWIMEGNTGSRRPLVTTGDLDGYIFSLSPDGKWLLYTRKSDQDNGTINTLWAMDITREELSPLNLNVNNIIHHAEWVPGSTMLITYSTVEPRDTAPGWQANNDLYSLLFNDSGKVVREREIIPSNSGGVYGWWGTSYFWSADGEMLAYARPDSIGIVDLEKNQLVELFKQIPLQTRGGWAWVAGVSWSYDHTQLYSVLHTPVIGGTDEEASPIFNISAYNINTSQLLNVVSQTGMFANPVCSPSGEGAFQIAYLQSIIPDQSETSRYRLYIMDRDGSNKSVLFPSGDSQGIDPKGISWSPFDETEKTFWLGLVYQGNIWLVNSTSGESIQITGDGTIGKISWR
jgi:hypothetical protein